MPRKYSQKRTFRVVEYPDTPEEYIVPDLLRTREQVNEFISALYTPAEIDEMNIAVIKVPVKNTGVRKKAPPGVKVEPYGYYRGNQTYRATVRGESKVFRTKTEAINWGEERLNAGDHDGGVRRPHEDGGRGCDGGLAL